MKRLGTMLAAIVALGLISASSALAATPNPWKVVGAPSNTSWTGAPSNTKAWSSKTWSSKSWSVAPAGTKVWGSRGWDVRGPSQAKGWGARGWGDVRQGTRTWDVRQGKRPADVRLHADWTWRASRVATRGWSDGS